MATTSSAQQPTMKKVNSIQEQLDLTQKQLLACIDVLNTSTSLFTKLSLIWQRLPLWQKILLGSLLTLPVVVGLVGQISLLAVFGLNLVIFSGLAWFFVSNHAQHHQLQTEEIKSTVLGLLKLLGTMIKNLDLLNRQLGEEVQVIKNVNKQLTSKCETLHEETQRLKSTNHSLDQSQNELLNIQQNLKTTIFTIDGTVSEQTTLLHKSQALLEETTLAYQKNQQQLSETISELGEVKKTLATEVEKAQRVTQTLKNTVQVISKEAIGTSQRREQFFQKLDRLINTQEAEFDTLVKGLAISGQQLAKTAQEFQTNNQRFNTLLTKQEEHLVRLAIIEPSQTTQVENLSEARLRHGFYPTAPKQAAIETAVAETLKITG